MITFESFGKIPRLSRECIITEKLDGTNAQVIITEDGEFGCASRNRLIVPGDDNFGFAEWAYDNKEELMELGVGRHFGEWWGQGIGRRYGLETRKFSLFNVSRWGNSRPACCDVVPTLYVGEFSTQVVEDVMEILRTSGSVAADGFNDPEGVIVYHTAAKQYFKKTFDKDTQGKGE